MKNDDDTLDSIAYEHVHSTGTERIGETECFLIKKHILECFGHVVRRDSRNWRMSFSFIRYLVREEKKKEFKPGGLILLMSE